MLRWRASASLRVRPGTQPRDALLEPLERRRVAETKEPLAAGAEVDARRAGDARLLKQPSGQRKRVAAPRGRVREHVERSGRFDIDAQAEFPQRRDEVAPALVC